MLSKEAGAPPTRILRKEDFIGMHGRCRRRHYKVAVNPDNTVRHSAWFQRMGPYRKNSGAIGGMDLYKVPNTESIVARLHEQDLSGNFRGPEFSQKFLGTNA